MRALASLWRADFLERTRGYRFLITLGLVLWLGYLVSDGTITLRLDAYRGVYNSAWVGSMMALVVNTFLGLFGFYLVKNAVARDRETGVGQILAATPLRRLPYLLGKWLSNFATLAVMVGVLAAVAIGLQVWQGEAVIDLAALLAPLGLISLPMMALTAAAAVLFEAVPFLRGTLGNVVYFFAWSAGLVFSLTVLGERLPALDPTGFALLMTDMQGVLRGVDPTAAESITLGVDFETAARTFVWPGLAWTPGLVAIRLALGGAAVGSVALAALFFDRFETAPPRLRRDNSPSAEAEAPARAASIQLAALRPVRPGFAPLALVAAELRLLVGGQKWWWYAVAGALMVAPLGVSAAGLPLVAALAYLWPVAVWSALGAREARWNTAALVDAAARPLARQLPAAWLAGVLVTAAVGAGLGVRLALTGGAEALITWAAGVAFIPALALAAGVWSGSPKLFEVVYMVLWYIGLANDTPALNFAAGPAATGVGFALAAALLLAAAGLGRHWRWWAA